jgi:outer membrane protein TolC
LRSWFAIAEANEQLVLVSEADQLYRTTLELVRERYEMALVDDGGAVAQLRIAESEVATNLERTAQYQGIRDQAIRQLETLLGRYPEGGLNGLLRLPKTPPSPPAGLPSQLLLRRPDILESERRFASAGRLLKQGKLAFFPSFTLTGSAGTTTDSLANIFNSDFGVWSLASGLFQPIWAGGALRSEYDRLKSEERLALANLKSVVLTAFKEVESALKEEDILIRREKSLKEALELAKSATESATEEYSAGTGDALTLITSQSKQIELASRLATLNRLRLDNRITLHLALGGDFTLSK